MKLVCSRIDGSSIENASLSVSSVIAGHHVRVRRPVVVQVRRGSRRSASPSFSSRKRSARSKFGAALADAVHADPRVAALLRVRVRHRHVLRRAGSRRRPARRRPPRRRRSRERRRGRARRPSRSWLSLAPAPSTRPWPAASCSAVIAVSSQPWMYEETVTAPGPSSHIDDVAVVLRDRAGSTSCRRSAILSVRYRIEREAPVPGHEVLLAVELADRLERVGHLVPVLELRRVDLLDEALVDVELEPAGVRVEDVGRVRARPSSFVDVGVGDAELERRGRRSGRCS